MEKDGDKGPNFSVNKYEPSDVKKLRDEYLKKGIELVNITSLCEFKLGHSGWCNEFNEPDEDIFHIGVFYRGEQIAATSGNDYRVIDDDKYLYWITNEDDPVGSDFIIFMKVRTYNDKKEKGKRRR